jgi:hypothetical protein
MLLIKDLAFAVSGLESTVAGGCVSVDSKGACCLVGCGGYRRSGARGRPCLARVAKRMGAAPGRCPFDLAQGKRAVRMAEWIGWRGFGEVASDE